MDNKPSAERVKEARADLARRIKEAGLSCSKPKPWFKGFFNYGVGKSNK